jgi:tetratricopeptide (TPR) repeat protein
LTDGARDAPARQRTLRATIDWSYDLLDAGEQALLRRLSIFVGGCTVRAAEAVAGGDALESDVLDAASSLVAKSLLRQQPGPTGETRVGMLETIRDYGLEHLRLNGELAPMRLRHATFYLSLAEEADTKLLTADQVHWLRRLEADDDNLRAIMMWSRHGSIDGEIGLRLAGSLAWFWVLSGVAWEAREWVEAMLALPSAAARTRLRARALHAAARIGIVRGDATTARRLAEESVAIFSELGDELSVGHGLTARASAELMAGDYAAAHQTIERSIVLAREIGARQVLAHALVQLAYLTDIEGDYRTAHPIWEEAVAVARTTGDRHTLGMAIAGLGHQARLRGDLDNAAALFHECLVLGSERGRSWRVTPRALGGLAGVAALAGDCVRSARLFGAAESLWKGSGKRDMPWWRAVFDADTSRVRAALGDAPYAEALAEGRAMRLEEALAYAFDNPTIEALTAVQPNVRAGDAHRRPDPANPARDGTA